MSRWPLLVLALWALTGAACGRCTHTQAPLNLPDGGAFRCVTSEDCPRTGNDSVCVTDTAPEFTGSCVSCDSTACVRVSVTCP